MLTGIVLVLAIGSLVYCVLTVIAAAQYRAVYAQKPRDMPPVSILKPLSGSDLGLEENLRSFFEQAYPEFEILLAVPGADDPAAALAERVRAQYPRVPSRLIVTGEAPYANAKVFSLDAMLAEARHDVVVMADSDVRVTPRLLFTLAAELDDERTGIVTCPGRAAPGPSIWSKLEGLTLNTEFLGGVLVARLILGMRFALGPTIAAKREALQDIGGMDAVKDYLSEDFVLGKMAAQAGWRVVLSSYIIEHRIGSQCFRASLKHRLRWDRGTRRSRPWGYMGQVFTNPLPLAMILVLAKPSWWPVLVVTAAFRALAGWATAERLLEDALTRRLWWLVPFADLASFLVWLAAFYGNTIVWRGRKYELLRDGRFRRV
ncbi:MAG: bacteriohopanetetrol glucosamine biosynthesis glycosyltransferase HpnI [Acidobacteriia bacterium]|nr:bacteriohopanetetrol glucosamine biosynthesis glycosyltransferase HpnI [Terriglobia bacterium]